MALTKEEREKWLAVLDRTGGRKKTGREGRVIPEDYKQWKQYTERKEVVVEVPSVGVPVKCYITMAKDRKNGCPVHVNMHGGGFIFLQDGDDDLYCEHLAARIHGIVVDIDYASSLDHAYPVAFEQSYRVVKWVFEQCESWGADPKKVSIGGHSAGGCLVAAISLKAAQTKDFKVCLQVLDYAANDNYMPMTDTSGKSDRSQAFSMLYADGDEELLKQPFVSPIFATADMMENQPETLIVNAQNCPFCLANEEYGRKLVEAGVTVTMRRFRESHHGFTVRMSDEWKEAQELIIRQILSANN